MITVVLFFQTCNAMPRVANQWPYNSIRLSVTQSKRNYSTRKVVLCEYIWSRSRFTCRLPPASALLILGVEFRTAPDKRWSEIDHYVDRKVPVQLVRVRWTNDVLLDNCSMRPYWHNNKQTTVAVWFENRLVRSKFHTRNVSYAYSRCVDMRSVQLRSGKKCDHGIRNCKLFTVYWGLPHVRKTC